MFLKIMDGDMNMVTLNTDNISTIRPILKGDEAYGSGFRSMFIFNGSQIKNYTNVDYDRFNYLVGALDIVVEREGDNA